LIDFDDEQFQEQEGVSKDSNLTKINNTETHVGRIMVGKDSMIIYQEKGYDIWLN